MNYKELKNALKIFKSEGLTDIRLNASKAQLQAEYDRLMQDNAPEAKVDFPDIAESVEEDVKLEEDPKAIVEMKEKYEVEELGNEEFQEIEDYVEEQQTYPDEELGNLLENAYAEVEDDSTDINTQSLSKFRYYIVAVLIAISIIGLIFATEKVLSNVKFLSDMYKFSI